MAEATKGLGLIFLFIQLPQPNERHYENIDCAVCQKTDWRFLVNIDVATLERNKFRPNVNSEKGALKQMHLGKHQRTDEGRFRRERADSLVKNLKKEYPALHASIKSLAIAWLILCRYRDSSDQSFTIVQFKSRVGVACLAFVKAVFSPLISRSFVRSCVKLLLPSFLSGKSC